MAGVATPSLGVVKAGPRSRSQQHALPVGMSSTAVHGQPVTSQQQREAHMLLQQYRRRSKISGTSRQLFPELPLIILLKLAALQRLWLEQKSTALVEKLEQNKVYMEQLAELPRRFVDEPHTQAQ